VHDVECAMWDNDYILLNRREINFSTMLYFDTEHTNVIVYCVWRKVYDLTTMIRFSWIGQAWTLVPFSTSTVNIYMLLYAVYNVEYAILLQGLHFWWCRFFVAYNDDKNYFWKMSSASSSSPWPSPSSSSSSL
jgi:hypothetical protein